MKEACLVATTTLLLSLHRQQHNRPVVIAWPAMEADNSSELTALLLHISQLHKSGIVTATQRGILKDRALAGDKVILFSP